MRITFQTFEVAPIDYEIVSIGIDTEAEQLGQFDDVYVSGEGASRLVCGYLSLESYRDAILVSSHGRRALALTPVDGAVVATALGGFARVTSHCWHAVRAGIAIEVDRSVTVAGHGDGDLRLSRPFRAALVHGPAADKVHARVTLLHSLRRVGGRHG